MAWTNSYYHFDAVGSTRGITDADQNIQASYPQTAFGEQLVESKAVKNPLKFVGQLGYYSDNETGLVNVRQRIYDAGLGRWLSQDPAPNDRNLYRYVTNSPLRASDPSGLQPPPDTSLTPWRAGGWIHDKATFTDDGQVILGATYWWLAPQKVENFEYRHEVKLTESQRREMLSF